MWHRKFSIFPVLIFIPAFLISTASHAFLDDLTKKLKQGAEDVLRDAGEAVREINRLTGQDQQPAAPSPQNPASTQSKLPNWNSDSQAVLDAQLMLSELGYNVGRPDGKYGRNTASAIRAFQQSSGLPLTGDVTPGLLAALEAKVPTPLATLKQRTPAATATATASQQKPATPAATQDAVQAAGDLTKLPFMDEYMFWRVVFRDDLKSLTDDEYRKTTLRLLKKEKEAKERNRNFNKDYLLFSDDERARPEEFVVEETWKRIKPYIDEYAAAPSDGLVNLWLHDFRFKYDLTQGKFLTSIKPPERYRTMFPFSMHEVRNPRPTQFSRKALRAGHAATQALVDLRGIKRNAFTDSTVEFDKTIAITEFAVPQRQAETILKENGFRGSMDFDAYANATVRNVRLRPTAGITAELVELRILSKSDNTVLFVFPASDFPRQGAPAQASTSQQPKTEKDLRGMDVVGLTLGMPLRDVDAKVSEHLKNLAANLQSRPFSMFDDFPGKGAENLKTKIERKDLLDVFYRDRSVQTKVGNHIASTGRSYITTKSDQSKVGAGDEFITVFADPRVDGDRAPVYAIGRLLYHGSEGLSCEKLLPKLVEKYGEPSLGCQNGEVLWLSLAPTKSRLQKCTVPLGISKAHWPVRRQPGSGTRETYTIDFPYHGSSASGDNLTCGQIIRVKAGKGTLSTVLVDFGVPEAVYAEVFEQTLARFNQIVDENARKRENQTEKAVDNLKL